MQQRPFTVGASPPLEFRSIGSKTVLFPVHVQQKFEDIFICPNLCKEIGIIKLRVKPDCHVNLWTLDIVLFDFMLLT